MTLPGFAGLRELESVDLPVLPPLEPMLAKVPPDAGVWSYEPKWDGFLH
jgi:ATP-dependent DNA ligase